MKEINELKAKVNIVDVIGRRVSLVKRGREWKGKCPFHDDHKASLMVNETKQVWGCFACGGDGGNNRDAKSRSAGDVFDFLLKYGLTWDEIKTELAGGNITSGAAVQSNNAKPSKLQKWTPLATKTQPGQIVHFRHGKPSKVWYYKNPDGKILSIVCRFDLADGGKEVLPYTYCTNEEGKKEWRWQAIPQNRPLYNLKDLVERPKANVMVVEGEKTAEAAQKLFPHLVVTTWQGGANGVHKTNWAILAGRVIILWPDNDKAQTYGPKHRKAGQIKPYHEQPGNMAMMEISTIISPTARKIKWVMNSPEFPDKWDLADAKDWTPEYAKEYANANLCDVPVPKPEEEEIQSNVPGPAFDYPPEEPPPGYPEEMGRYMDNAISDFANYFTFLGYQKDSDTVKHCFFVKETRTVLKYAAGQLSRSSSLIQLAPLDFWEGNFSPKRGKSLNLEMALNWLCRVSHENGFFSANRLRGRGAWFDDGKSVFHSGDCLIIGGRKVALGTISSKYVYEAGPELGIEPKKPLTTFEANKLMEVVNLINFERGVDSYLLAGWCVIAPICGALNWRSHIWVTGSAGSGKSWVLQHVIRAILGKTGVAVQSQTTEPGLRQLLGSDALPVVFDEAEGEDEKSQRRMQDVLNLMRAASAEDGGIMAKGSSGGNVHKYTIRSCFAFASIGISVNHQSDRSRITIISLKNGARNDETRAKRWKELQAKHAEIITPEFVERLMARTVWLIPVILENARIFAAAAAAELGAQRTGDQVGTILAGVYSLFSNDVISYEKAVDFIKRHQWEEEKSMDDNKDEIRLFGFLMESLINVQSGGKAGVSRTVGELVFILLQAKEDAVVSADVAREHLLRVGIAVDAFNIYFSNTSTNLHKLLRSTPWASNHHKILLRIEGATMVEGVVFANYLPARAVAIPQLVMLSGAYGWSAKNEPDEKEPKTEEALPF